MIKSSFLHLFFFILVSPVSLIAEDWNRSTGNNESHLYSKDVQINQSNIQNLSNAFLQLAHEIEALGVQSSPIFIGDKLIVNAIENVLFIHITN